MRGSSLSMKYYVDDAAASIAELIEDEERKLHRAQEQQLEQEERLLETLGLDPASAARTNLPNRGDEAIRRSIMSKRSAAIRDFYRAETAVRVLKQSLQLVLLEHACRDGKKHSMPDVDAYLASRAPAA